MKNFFALILSIIICELAGAIGTIFTVSAIPSWYSTLIKPALNPPAWVFGPVWTTLYALMGIAAFLVWKKGWESKDVKIALGIFATQLVLNAAWSVLFFDGHSAFWALMDISALWLAIALTMLRFERISKPAAYLLVPYLFWVTFATYLNFSIVILN